MQLYRIHRFRKDGATPADRLRRKRKHPGFTRREALRRISEYSSLNVDPFHAYEYEIVPIAGN